jgi:predicted metal-dependent HD superfamily phosphohydrolase
MKYMNLDFNNSIHAMLNLTYDVYNTRDIATHYNTSVVDNNGTFRFYHNWDHILSGYANLFDYFNNNPSQRINKVLVWAWLTHDYIYRTDGTDNELESFKAARKLLLSPSLINGDKGLWLCTKHNNTANTHDQQLICDVDLASLGDWWEAFEATNRLVEFEWAAYPRLELVRGRKEFFEALLARPYIYYLNWFRNKYEEQARCNIERLIKSYNKEISNA